MIWAMAQIRGPVTDWLHGDAVWSGFLIFGRST
jgi:hypothetical protein